MRPAPLAVALAVAFALPAAAAIDVAGLDPGIDPCTDFYQHANKRWLETTQIPDDRTAVGTFSIIDKRNEDILERALRERMAKRPAAGTAERKVVDFYASGMDTAAIEKAGLAPLKPLFEAIDRVESPESLARVLARLESVGINAGFAFSVEADRGDSTRYLAGLGQGGLGMPDRDYYLLDDARSKALREGYLRHVARTFELAGEAPAEAQAKAAQVMDLETAMARVSWTRVERRDDVRSYNKMAVEKLAADAPGFPWKAYLAALGAGNAAQLNVAHPSYFAGFARLAAERPASEWRTYLRWHVLRATATKLPEPFEAEAFDFYEKQLRGAKAMAPRHRRVVLAIGGRYGAAGMGQAVGQIFVGETFSPQAKVRALELVADVKEALRARILKAGWMSEEAKRASMGKLDAMAVKIGYPDKWRDFSSLEIGNVPFVDNWMRSRAFDHRRDLSRIGQPVDRTDWFMAPYIVNAYYSPPGNEIVFPAAILQPPYFDAKADDASNYGGIGMIIGHEITHGFDDTGRLYDAKGNLREWWTPEDSKRYTERAQRVVRQYGEYEGPPGAKTNGQLTLGENIADIGGLKIAYDALQRALARKPQGPIDGLSPEQRFFIAFAQDWRALSRPERERELLLTDTHSLPRHRVKGTLVQVPEFARAFSCNAKQVLLPEDAQANIW